MAAYPSIWRGGAWVHPLRRRWHHDRQHRKRCTRKKFGIANARNANADQKAKAFDSYFHYAGPWRIEGEDVVHAVTMSLNPEMTSNDQRRRAQFRTNGELTLAPKEALKDGPMRRHIL
jgi:Lipocalin-like domain